MITEKPLAGALGAEIEGIDLTQTLSANDYKQIRKLLIKNEVIFFRNQDISPAQQKALADSFGPLQTHPAYETVEDFPDITILESTAENPTKIEAWHSDMTCRQHPPIASILRSKITPEKGGDTLWSSMTAAYDNLSGNMKSFLDGLSAVHDFRYGFKESLEEKGGADRLSEAVKENPPVEHPIIQTHPESGKKVIFVNSLFTTHIVGLNRLESRAILDFLFDHIRTPEFTCRFSWEPNCIALWDNRSTQHKPINDYFPQHRKLHRITIYGDKPY